MKILRKILKIIRNIVISIILFMILMVVGAKIFESQLASFALEKLENEVDAPMSIGKVSLIPLFSFPRFSAEINNLWLGDPETQKNDTLFFINSLKVGLNTWDLINGIYTIDKVKISGLSFDYTLNKSGKSNIDFLLNAFVDTTSMVDTIALSPENTAPGTLDLTAEKIELENIRMNYFDSLTNTGAQVYIPEISIKAKAKNDIYQGATEGGFVLSNCHFEETNINQMQSCTVNFELEFEDKEATIKKLLISSEGINVSIDGTFGFIDTLTIDANLKANLPDFELLKKYIPGQYIYLFEETKIGKASCNVNIEMEYIDNDVSIKKLLVISEGIDLGMEGTFRIGDTISMNTNIVVKNLDFDILKKYIPIRYTKEYGIIDFGGIADISVGIKGEYADSTILPLVDANVNFKNIRLQTIDYPEIRKLNLKTHITNGKNPDMSSAVVTINNLELSTSKSSLNLRGSIHGFATPQYNISTNLDINLQEFGKYIPDSLAQNIEGNIVASINTNGTLPEVIPDDFADYVLNKTTLSVNFKDISALLNDSLQINNLSADFDYSPQVSGTKTIVIKNLNLKAESLNINLQNSSLSAILSGKISDPLKMGANIQSFRFQNGNNLIAGSADIKNFATPELDIYTNLSLDLEELKPFAPDSLIKNMTGFVTANVQMKGKINPDSLDTQLYPLIFEKSRFGLKLSNVTLEFPDSAMNVENISGRIMLDNDILRIDGLSAIYNGLSIKMDSTIVQHIYKAILLNQKEELYVKTHIRLGDIFFDEFKYLMALDITNPVTEPVSAMADTSVDTNITGEPQNWTYLIHGSVSVNRFIMDSTVLEGYKINRLHLDDISALFKLTDSTYIFDQFKFKAFEGEMNNSFNYKIRADGTQSVSSHNIIQNMNIRTLLRDMDNFGMDSLITSENISGILSSDLNTFTPIDDSVLIDKMMISGDITLAEGGVYNYEPAQEISKFTRIKELDNIQFKTLRSNIFMFKNKLYVPRTNIVSNALDIAAFGMQSMGDDYEYHLEVHLSNILFGKSKGRNKKQDESGDEIDEELLKKSSHKVRYANIEGDSKVGWDTKAAREEMMNKIRVQQKMLDFIFFPKNIHYNTGVDKKN